ncbi:MAG: Gldg family protein [Chloroflexi bacterium]|nr:Gldg family protein [Chloroflexota bacterium]
MMRYRALILKDLKSFFDQPTGYVLLILFVGLLSYFFFRSALLSGQASLRPLISLLPWFFAILVPAATMRLLAEEERDGTIELLLTHPVREIDVVVSKFAAGWLFMASALAATLPIPVALMTAGTLDLGAVFAQYVGALLLAAALVAVGLFTSSLTRNQIVAFLLGVALTFALLFSGLEFIFAPLPAQVGTLVRDLSLLTHFESVARGVLDVSDLLYFSGLVLAFLSLTYLLVRRRAVSPGSRAQRLLVGGVAGLVLGGVAMGWVGGLVPGRIDLTNGRVHTLSPATAELVEGLDDLLTIEVFASKDLPTQASLRYREIRDFFADYQRASGGNVRVAYLFPSDDPDAQSEAQRLGIPQVQFNVVGENELSVQRGYLGAAFLYTDRVETIPFIDDTAGLEYRVASLTYKLSQTQRKTIGFLTGHGERERDLDALIFTAALEEQFDVVDIAPSVGGAVELAGVAVVIVAGPSEPIPEETRRALHGYLADGGKALLLFEPVDIDAGTLTAAPAPFSFADFVAAFGVAVNADLVYDTRSNEMLTFGAGGQSFVLPYPFWTRVLVSDRGVAGNVESVLLAWPSSVTAQGRENIPAGLEILPLFQTTEFAGRQRGPYQIVPDLDAPPGPIEGVVTVGVIVQASQARTDTTSGQDTRMVVMGDADWLADGAISRSPGNLVAALNLIDWLAGEDSLARIRSKGPGVQMLRFDSPLHERAVRFGNLIGIPVLILAFGIVRYVARRRSTRRMYRRAT